MNLIGAQSIARFKSLPGLRVCDRIVFSDATHAPLIRSYAEFEFGILMPWIEGKVWSDIVGERRDLSRKQCERTARYFIDVMHSLEINHMAHCDIAGTNVIVLPDQSCELIDVEEMYAPGLQPPQIRSAGSIGYNHRVSANGIWDVLADRFAVAVMLLEMLLWFDQEFRDLVPPGEQQLFQESEMQEVSQKFDRSYQMMRSRYPSIFSDLFESAWFSQNLEGCPPASTWARAFREAGLGTEIGFEPRLLADISVRPSEAAIGLEAEVVIRANDSVTPSILPSLPSTPGLENSQSPVVQEWIKLDLPQYGIGPRAPLAPPPPATASVTHEASSQVVAPPTKPGSRSRLRRMFRSLLLLTVKTVAILVILALVMLIAARVWGIQWQNLIPLN